MKLSENIVCPKCNNNTLIAKYEATYVYSYHIDSNELGLKNEKEFFPFLFDNREQKDNKQYIECSTCGAQYPCSFTEEDNEKGIHITILQKAIRADHAEKPEFFG